MRKLNKILAGTLAVALSVPVMTMPVFAAAGTGTTPVSYDNRNMIPDPDNPADPQWAVLVPSAIKFTDEQKTVDTTIELTGMNGKPLAAGLSVDVTVASTNGYTLNNEDDSQKLAYELYAEGTLVTDTVATLTDTNTKKPGNAVLKGTATSLGSYTDTLTYTAEKK